MMKPRPIRRHSPSEEGYILIAVVFLLALLVLAMSIALPNITKQIERDREVETMHRGKQYVRALKLYHKKFGNYPPTVDALINTNQIRFLRKKYIDPSTGKDEWKPIHFGQNKQPTAFGFFGKPMTSTMGGMGMGCGNNGLGAGIGSSSPSTNSFSTNSPSTNSFSSPNGLNSSMGMGSNSPLGGCQPDASGAASGGSGVSSTSGNPNDPSNPNGTNGASGNSTDNPGGGNNGNNSNNSTGSTDSASSSGSSSSGSSSGSSLTTSSLGGASSGLSGQRLGGGGIIGFSPGSPKKTILLYKKQNHFNQWEFVYDPAQDQMLQIGGGSTGLQQSGSMPGSNGIGSPGGFGNSPSGFGNSPSGFGNSPGGFGNSPGGFGNTGNTNSGSGSSDSGTSGSGSTSGSSDSGSTYSPAR